MKKKFKICSFICLLFFPLLVVACGSESPVVINNKTNENISIFLSQKEKINMNKFNSDNSISTDKIAENVFDQAVTDNKVPNSQNISFNNLIVSNVNLNLANLKSNIVNNGSIILKFSSNDPLYTGVIRIGFWYTLTIFNFTINLKNLIDATKYNYFANLGAFENSIWTQAQTDPSWQTSAPKSITDYDINFNLEKMPVDKNQENISVPFTLTAKWKIGSSSIDPSTITILGNFIVHHLRLPSYVLNPLNSQSVSSLRQIMWSMAAKNNIVQNNYKFISSKQGAIVKLQYNSWIKYNLLFQNKNTNLFLNISGYFLLRTKPGPTPIPIPVPNPPGGGPSGAKVIKIYLQEPYLINSLTDAPTSGTIWNDVNQYLINDKIITTNLSSKNFYQVYNLNNQLVSWSTAIKDIATNLITNDSLSANIPNINYNNFELFALNNTFSTSFESDLDIYVSFIGNINKYQLPNLITNIKEYSDGNLAYNNFLLKAIKNFITKNNLPDSYTVTNSSDFINQYNNALKNSLTKLPFNLMLQFSDNSKICLIGTLNLISVPITTNLSVNLSINYYDSSREKPSFFATEAKILINQIWSQTSKKILLNNNLKGLMLNNNLWNLSDLQNQICQDLNNNNLNIKTFTLKYFDQNVYNGTISLTFKFNPVDIKSDKDITLGDLGSYNIPYLISESKNNTLYLQEINKIIYTLKQKLPTIIANKSPLPHLPVSLTLVDWNYMFQQIKNSLLSVTKLGPNVSTNVSYKSDLKNTTFLYDGILSFTLTFTFKMSSNIGWGQ